MTNTKKIKIAFFGTPELTIPILDSLAKSGYELCVVITAPDKAKGRGLEIFPPAPKTWALKRGIPLLQPEKIDATFIEELKKYALDLGVVVAYGKILPQKLLDLPRLGMVNVHYSLLPKYRGASPVEAAILNGEKETGVSIQKMVLEMDAGAIMAEEKVAIGEKETAPALRNRLNDMAKEILPKTIEQIISGTAEYHEQNKSQATFCKKINKEMGLVDLEKDSPQEIFRKFKAFQPWPGVYFFRNGNRVIIKSLDFENDALVIKKVLSEGGKEISYQDFLRQN